MDRVERMDCRANLSEFLSSVGIKMLNVSGYAGSRQFFEGGDAVFQCILLVSYSL